MGLGEARRNNLGNFGRLLASWAFSVFPWGVVPSWFPYGFVLACGPLAAQVLEIFGFLGLPWLVLEGTKLMKRTAFMKVLVVLFSPKGLFKAFDWLAVLAG